MGFFNRIRSIATSDSDILRSRANSATKIRGLTAQIENLEKKYETVRTQNYRLRLDVQLAEKDIEARQSIINDLAANDTTFRLKEGKSSGDRAPISRVIEPKEKEARVELDLRANELKKSTNRFWFSRD